MPSIIKVDQIQSDTGTVNLSSNVTFSTGQRIRGNFSDSTVVNRVAFQTTSTNSSTVVHAIPNGTGNSGYFETNSADDPTNSSMLQFGLSGSGTARILSSARGSGTALPLTFDVVSERMRITTDGVVELTNGKIKFPASQQASTDPNTLDDYEEGEWTPSFRGNDSAPTISYGTRIGRYVKIGRLVVATCRVSADSRSGGSGDLAVSGFPFNFWNIENFQAGAVEQYNFGSWPSNIYSIAALGIGGTNYMNLIWNGSGTRTNLQVGSLVAGAGLIITVAYQVE